MFLKQIIIHSLACHLVIIHLLVFFIVEKQGGIRVYISSLFILITQCPKNDLLWQVKGESC